jgi:preprotein translocase subunit SecE
MESDKSDKSLAARPKEWWLTTRDFFRDTNSEMKKVTWPSRNEVVGTTGVVLVATVIFAVYLWGCDVVFYKMIDFLFTKFGVST